MTRVTDPGNTRLEKHFLQIFNDPGQTLFDDPGYCRKYYPGQLPGSLTRVILV